jgi:ABC-type branched-subunit amino acid transport system substrate-binding protein
MHTRKTRRSGVMLIASTLVAGLLPVAGTAGTAVAAGAKHCAGPPIKLMSAAGVDVQGGFPALAQPEVLTGARAAAAAENKTCRLGQPLEIITCDDHSTIPGAIDCAQQAVAQGVVAVVGDTGPWPAKMLPTLEPAGVPLVGCACSGPDAYPIAGNYLAHVTLAASLGAKKLALLTDPGFAPLVPALKQQADKLGVEIVAVIAVPFNATDLSPYVTQATAAGADSLLPAFIQRTQRVAAIEALHEAGVPVGNGFTVVAGPILVTPTQVKQLGAAAEGVTFLGATWTTGDQSNPGIKEYFKELRAAGEPTNIVSEPGVLAWSMTHSTVGFLTKAATKDSRGLIDVLDTRGAVNRAEIVHQDFTRNDNADASQSPYRDAGSTQFATQVQHGKVVMLVKHAVPMLETYKIPAQSRRSAAKR